MPAAEPHTVQFPQHYFDTTLALFLLVTLTGIVAEALDVHTKSINGDWKAASWLCGRFSSHWLTGSAGIATINRNSSGFVCFKVHPPSYSVSVPLVFRICSSLLLELLEEWVGLALGRLDAVGPHNAGGPVEVEHVDELLALHLQILDLGLQVRVHHLQPLRLLRGRERRERKKERRKREKERERERERRQQIRITVWKKLINTKKETQEKQMFPFCLQYALFYCVFFQFVMVGKTPYDESAWLDLGDCQSLSMAKVTAIASDFKNP